MTSYQVQVSGNRNKFCAPYHSHSKIVSRHLSPQELTKAFKAKNASVEGIKRLWDENCKVLNEIHYSALWSSLSEKKAKIDSHGDHDKALLVATQRQFNKCRPRQLATIANALSKLGAGDRDFWRELAITICNQNDYLRGCTPQGLAMLANGLSKQEGERIEDALKAIAEEVNRCEDLSKFEPQHLALLANGLSKQEGKRIEDALKAIAEEVNCRKDLSKFNSQDLAMLANGLSKQEGKRKKDALKAIAKEVNCRKDLSKFEPQHLAMLANDFSKQEGKLIEDALRVIAEEVNRCEDLSKFSPQNLAMLANGFSKQEGKKMEDALEAIAKEVSCLDLFKFNPQDLALLANGFSKQEGESIENALRVVAEDIGCRALSIFNSQDLTLLANSLSKQEGEYIENALKAIAEEVSCRDLSTFNVQDIANILFAFTQRDLLDHPAYLKVLHAACRLLEDPQVVFGNEEYTQLLQVKLFLQYQKPEILHKMSPQASLYLDDFEQNFSRQVPQSSVMHQKVTEQLKRLYPDQQILSEQYLAATFLDIVIPEKKIAIHVNGPFHYIKGTQVLKADSAFAEKLTEKVLQQINMHSIVIPYWEWGSHSTEEQKNKYLQSKINVSTASKIDV